MFMSIKICFSCNNTFWKNNEVLWSFSSLLLGSTSSTMQAQLATQGPWCQVAEDILVAVTNSLLVGCAECCSGSNEVVYVSVTWLGYRKSRCFDFFFPAFGELCFKLACVSGELVHLTARLLTDPSPVLHVSTYMMKDRKNLHSAILVFHTNLHAAITATHISFDNSLMHQAS